MDVTAELKAEYDWAARAVLADADVGLSLRPLFFAADAVNESLRGVDGSRGESAAVDIDTSWPPRDDGKYEAALWSAAAVLSISALLAVMKLAYSVSLSPRPRLASSAFSGEMSSGDGAGAALFLSAEEEAEDGV